MNRILPLSIVLLILIVSPYASANTISVQDAVLNQVEATLPKLNNKEFQQFTVLPNTTHAVVAKPIASSEQRFLITHIEIDKLPPQLDFLRALIKEKTNREYGLAEVNQLVQELNTKLATKGYVTSKVYVEPQSLSSGKRPDIHVSKIKKNSLMRGASRSSFHIIVFL